MLAKMELCGLVLAVALKTIAQIFGLSNHETVS